MADSIQGRFLWHQLNTTDLVAPQAFYKDLAGWEIQTVPAMEGRDPYPMFVNNGIPRGGILKMPTEALAGGAQPHWLGYIGADDVDETYAKALDLGANSCVAPQDLPGAGRFAVLMDPWGAFFAIFKPASPPPAAKEAGQGEICWHELVTGDLQAGWKFYQDLFGWEIFHDLPMGEMGDYRLWGRQGIMLGGMMAKGDQAPFVCWTYYVRVSSAAEAAAKIEKNGGQVMMGPMEVPDNGIIVVLNDPQGAMFAVHEQTAPSDPEKLKAST